MSGQYHKIAVNFPEELYKRIKKRAAKHKRSFSEEAVDLVSCGIFDMEESEALEPKGKQHEHT